MMTLDEIKLFAEQTESEFWVLVLPYDYAENLWYLLVATPEQMAIQVDIKNLPVSMTLLKGEPARVFLIDRIQEHETANAERQLKRRGGSLS